MTTPDETRLWLTAQDRESGAEPRFSLRDGEAVGQCVRVSVNLKEIEEKEEPRERGTKAETANNGPWLTNPGPCLADGTLSRTGQ